MLPRSMPAIFMSTFPMSSNVSMLSKPIDRIVAVYHERPSFLRYTATSRLAAEMSGVGGRSCIAIAAVSRTRPESCVVTGPPGMTACVFAGIWAEGAGFSAVEATVRAGV